MDTAAGAGPLGPGSVPLTLRAADGVVLRAAVLRGPEPARGAVLLLQGRTEFLEKHAPVADALVARGFTVAAIDWRGQGGSARALADPRKGHVARFAEYQADLDAFLACPVVAGAPEPRIALAHSMGGSIALRALAEGRLPVEAAVFSAPMWGLKLGRAGNLVARGLAAAAAGLGFGDRYALGGGPESYAETDPEPNVLTADPERAAQLKALTLAHPDLALGGPTWGWLRAAYREMAALKALSCPTPALVVVGGDERVTDPAAMAARATRDGMALETVPGGRHELYLETPERREAFWAAIDRFLAARGI